MAFRMTHAQAVAAGVVVPLRLLVFNMTERYANLSRADFRVAAEQASVPRDEAELLVAVMAAMDDYSLDKAFSFHASVRAAQSFQRRIDTLQPLLTDRPVEPFCVWGAQPARERQASTRILVPTLSLTPDPDP